MMNHLRKGTVFVMKTDPLTPMAYEGPTVDDNRALQPYSYFKELSTGKTWQIGWKMMHPAYDCNSCYIPKHSRKILKSELLAADR